MSKKIRTVIIALVVLILLIVAMILLNSTKPDDTNSDMSSTDDVSITLINEELDALEYINIKNEHGEYQIIKDEEMSYSVVGLEDLKLSGEQLSAAVNQSINVNASQLIEENASDIAQFGLEEPAIEIEVKITDKPSQTIYIGDESSTGELKYLKKDGDNNVYAIGASDFTTFYHDKYFYFDTNMVEAVDFADTENPVTINEVSITRPDLDKPIVLTKEDELDKRENEVSLSELVMTSPVSSIIKQEEYESKLKTLFGLSATSIVDTDQTKEEYGFTEPTSVITMKYNDQTITVTTGAGILCEHDADEDLSDHTHEITGYYAKVEGNPLVYNLASTSATWLDMQPDDLIASYLVMPSILDLASVTITSEGVDYLMEFEALKTEEGKDEVGKITVNGKELESTHCKSMLSLAYDTAITGISSTDKIPSQPATTTIKYTYKDGKTDVVEMYELEDRTGLAVLNKENVFKSRPGINDKIANELKNLIAGEPVDTEW